MFFPLVPFPGPCALGVRAQLQSSYKTFTRTTSSPESFNSCQMISWLTKTRKEFEQARVEQTHNDGDKSIKGASQPSSSPLDKNTK